MAETEATKTSEETEEKASEETEETTTESEESKDTEAKLRRELAEARKAQRKAEKAAKEAAEQKAKDEGKWKELAEQRESELKEANERAAEAERKGTIETVAKRLKFRNPSLAHRLIGSDTGDDEAEIERELKRLAEEETYLVGEEGGGSRPAGSRKRETKASFDANIRKARRG